MSSDYEDQEDISLVSQHISASDSHRLHELYITPTLEDLEVGRHRL